MKNQSSIFLVLLGLAASFMACGGGASGSGNGTGADSLAAKDSSAEASYFPSRTEIKEDGVSPLKLTTGMIGEVKVSIQYGSPSVKGRQVWGALVPYGEVWRSGANQATWIEFSKEVMVNNQKLAQGRYGFFTIPGEEEWTVIFNEVWDIWGAYDYSASRDVLRFTGRPFLVEEHQESLEFAVNEEGIVLMWDKLRLLIPVSKI